MDNLSICKRCGSDCCYIQEVSPTVKNYSCLGCGFITNSLMKKGEQFFEEQMEVLPNLYKELMGEDGDGLIWMPSTVNVHEKGMVFANGTSANDWKWAGVKAVEVSKSEEKKFPIPGKKNEFYKWRMSMETMKEFDERDYIGALEYVGLI